MALLDICCHALDASSGVFSVTSCCSFCLQDIVENEDIKLDMMFMASLVHDLIKVGRPKQRMLLAENS